MKQIYVCTDTITGLYSALHDAWKENRDGDAGVEIRGHVQHQLFCEYQAVEETSQKAFRLERMIKRYLGYNACWDIYHALLSDNPQKGNAVFHAMQESRKLKDSRRIMEHLGNEDVANVFAMSRSVANEAHVYEEFIRFRELKNGILFSEISPKAQVLTCIGDHFSDRFPLENWLIFDKTHQVSLVHRKQSRWELVWGELPDGEAVEELSDDERDYEELWRCFFESVSVKERENPRCQRGHLPLRYRDNMPEFQEKGCLTGKIRL